MSRYFRNYPRIFYKFGNEANNDVFQNIAIYPDVIDQVRDQVTAYQDYYILPDERPDQVSFKLYGTPDYHWTFYLMNPKLRESGWPLSSRKLFEFAEDEYTHTILTTLDFIYDKFKVGQTMSGVTSGASAVITKRDLQLGQIWIANTPNPAFINGEVIQSTNSSGVLESITLNSSVIQYNAIHHYENDNSEYVDLGIDSATGNYLSPGAQRTPVTWIERLKKKNDDLLQIRVVKPNIIESVAESFRDALG